MINITDTHFRKKLLITILSMALAVACLAGCGEKDGDIPDDAVMAEQDVHGGENAEGLPEAGAGKQGIQIQDNEGGTSAAGSSEAASAGASSGETELSADTASANNGDTIEILHPVVGDKTLSLSRPVLLSDHYGDAISVKWNTFSLSEEEAAKWPRLAKALKKISAEADTRARNAYDNMQEQLQGSIRDEQENLGYDPDGEVPREWYLELDGWPYSMNLEDEMECTIIRSDSVAFSVKEYYYSYLGGAHPYYAYGGHSFDTQTGHELMVEDVIADLDRLNDILFEKLMTEYEELDLDERDVRETLAQLKAGEYEYAWLLDRDKVTFYFNPYMLTSFAGGAQEINIFFTEYPDLFEETYTKAPEDFVRALGDGGSLSFDLDGDGAPEEISVIVGQVTDDYGNTYNDKITLYVDEREESEELFEDTYFNEIFLVHTQGSTYIYGRATWYEDPFWQCYDISDGHLRDIGDADCRGPLDRGWVHAYENRSYEMTYCDSVDYFEAFTDPARFRLNYWAYVLGSTESMKTYYVGDDGLPKTDDEVLDVTCSWYDHGSEENISIHVFTTKVDLTMDVLDEEFHIEEIHMGKIHIGELLAGMGSVKESGVKIPAGTKLTYIRTDEKSYADFALEDGRVVRAVIDPGDIDMGIFTQYICGIDCEEALDGVIFEG